MIDQQTKQSYINTIKETGVGHPVVEAAELFINNYDGNNEKYLKILCFAITGLLFTYQENQIKADAYDRIKGVQGDTQKELDEMKEIFEAVERGELPPEPAVGHSE